MNPLPHWYSPLPLSLYRSSRLEKVEIYSLHKYPKTNSLGYQSNPTIATRELKAGEGSWAKVARE
jgi:hypothetical protein